VQCTYASTRYDDDDDDDDIDDIDDEWQTSADWPCELETVESACECAMYMWRCVTDVIIV
jgi:hypothetical protein